MKDETETPSSFHPSSFILDEPAPHKNAPESKPESGALSTLITQHL